MKAISSFLTASALAFLATAEGASVPLSVKPEREYLLAVVDRVWESESIRLQEAGFQLGFDCKLSACPVRCDADAIAQVLASLIVEDDPNILLGLTEALTSEGYEV